MSREVEEKRMVVPPGQFARGLILAALLCLLGGTSALAQQINSPLASLSVNGVDDSGFPMRSIVEVPGDIEFGFKGDASEPFALLVGAFDETGTDFGDAGFLNIKADSILIALNGFDPQSGLDAQAVMGTARSKNLYFPTNVSGLDFYAQSLVTDATAINGVRLSGSTRVLTESGTRKLVFFDQEDQSRFLPLTNPVDFGGSTWNGIWVNSNGNVTFGVGDNSDQPTATAMNSGILRIAPFWRDLDPRFEGRVAVREDVLGMTVEYRDVPIVDPTTGQASYQTVSGALTVFHDGVVEIDVDRAPKGIQITGIAPGTSPGTLPRNFSTEVPIALAASESVFEIYSDRHPFDLPSSVLSYRDDMTGFVLEADQVGLNVIAISPATGPDAGAASLLIRGTGFPANAQVFVGGNPSGSVDVRSPDEILVLTPAGSIGMADVEVVNPTNSKFSTLPAAYEYVALTAIGGSTLLQPGTSVEVPFALGFTFPVYGRFVDRLWMNANGTITFDGPDADPVPSPNKMNSGLPRIAVMWNDWQWGANSLAAIHTTPYFMTLAFVDVESPVSGGELTFIVMLSHHGEVFLMYPEAPNAAENFLTGFSAGYGISPNAGLVDASLFAGPTAPFASMFESFGPAHSNAFDLTGFDWDIVPVVYATEVFSSSIHN